MMQTKDIARVCHEANRAYCKTLGDDSQPSWEEAANWRTESAVSGVKFHAESPRTAEASHAKWCEHKLRNGWVYGPEKSDVTKTHPCLVPWGELSPEQKRKDLLFRAICRALLEDV